jgi:hypothetical protein
MNRITLPPRTTGGRADPAAGTSSRHFGNGNVVAAVGRRCAFACWRTISALATAFMKALFR